MILEENDLDIDKTMEDWIGMGAQKENQPTPTPVPKENKASEVVEEEGSAFDESAEPEENIPTPKLENKMSQENIDAMIAAEMQMEYQQRADQYLIEQQIRENSIKEAQEEANPVQVHPQNSQVQPDIYHQNNIQPNPVRNKSQNKLKNIITEKVYEEIVFHHPKTSE